MCAKKSGNQCIALRSPLNGSLSWWLCLTSKQTVIHMSVLWPRFHLEQFHRGHWKQKSSRVKDLNPSPASAHEPLPHISSRPLSKGRFIYVGSTSVVFLYLFPHPLAWEESDSEEFPSTGLSLSRRLVSDSRFRWNVGASAGVSCKNPIPIYFWGIQQISFQSGILVAHQDKTCAICLEMRRQVWIIACTTKHVFSSLHLVPSPLWNRFKRNV